MSCSARITTTELKDVFGEEIRAGGGQVTSVFAHHDRLFARSTLPWVREVRPKDKVQGGVAMRASMQEIWVHPYLFRQVCRNGAIMCWTTRSSRIRELYSLPCEKAAAALREAVHACCDEDSFTAETELLRTGAETAADLVLNMSETYRAAIERFGPSVADQISEQFMSVRDRSLFGLGNAVTAAARTEADPEVRWRMEEFGGGILVGHNPVPQNGPLVVASRRVG
jgi:hypothetical protein